MTDITINIKTGSENSEPKVITTLGNTKTAVPKTKSPEVETPKEVITPEKESEKKDDSKKMPALSSDRDMTEEEHAKMSSDKTQPSEEPTPKQEAPKEQMKDDALSKRPTPKEKSSENEESKKMPALSSDRGMTKEEHAKMGAKK